MLTAIVTVIIFLVLISLHEFGHFIMAKACGVKVLEFSVGMGPAIFKKQGKETLYSVRIFPVGGYCKLEGEDVKTDDERAFCNQKLYKRFLVVCAGAIFNIILGFVLIVIMTAVKPVGEDGKNLISTPVIDKIVEHSNIENSGLQSGDRIIEIDGHKIRFFEDISLYTDKFLENQTAAIKVKRGNEELTFEITPTVNETIYEYGEDYATVKSTVNGYESESIVEYTEEQKAQIDGVVGKTASEKRLIIGFTAKTQEVGFNNIFTYSFHYTGYVVRLVYRAFWNMITGATGFSEVSGPVGIVSAVNTAVNTGSYMMVNILYLSALLTINLGVFNLLPLPALDGGRLFFMLIELIRRKPIPAEKEGMVHAIGLVLLLILSVIISFNDVIKIIAN